MATIAFSNEAARLQKVAHLAVSDLARATNADQTTVRAWLRKERAPKGARAERLAELSSLVERLRQVMDAGYIPVWLRSPIPLLDDDKPIDVIASGEYRRVSSVIAGLEAGGAV